MGQTTTGFTRFVQDVLTPLTKLLPGQGIEVGPIRQVGQSVHMGGHDVSRLHPGNVIQEIIRP